MAIERYDGLAPVPGSVVNVFEAGTQVPVTLYADALGTPLANPFLADARTGVYYFFAETGSYDIVLGTTGDPATRDPVLPFVLFAGESPNRYASLVVDDPEYGEIVLVQQVY